MGMLLANSAKFSLPENADPIRMYYGTDKLGGFVRADLGNIKSSVVKNNQYRLQMIRSNDIPHLLEPVVGEIDNRVVVRFDITGLVNITHLSSQNRFRSDFVKKLFLNIGETCEKTRRYLLLESELNLSPNSIFYDFLSEDYRFIYLPGYNAGFLDQITQLLEFIVVHFDEKDEDGLMKIHKALARIDVKNCDNDETVNMAIIRGIITCLT